MKKILLVLMTFVILTGCMSKEEVKEDKFNIVTSFYPIYIFTQNIAKDIPNVTVTNMSDKHLGCLHDYNLTTSDMKLIESADAFVINGVGLESFLEKAYSIQEDLEVIDSGEGIEYIPEISSDENNEHIWLSLTNAITQVNNIGNKLASIDKEHEEMYLANTDEYVKKLEELRNQLREEMYQHTDVKLITSHDAFSYFAKDFGFEVVGVIEKEEGASPTAKELQDLIGIIKDNDIKAIFIENDDSTKVADIISSESGARVFLLDTITSGDGNLQDYENKIKDNIKVIKESFN